ncbi:MAG: hypothetical protein RL662_1080 [Bacteroidota bacterium]|jgi:hypothetical protein
MIYPDQKTKDFIQQHESDDLRQLALRTHSFTKLDMPYVLQQIGGRQVAKHKLPYWYAHQDIIYPAHLSMEQCSSELTARYKARLCKGATLVDLTGGLGVDFSFMAQNMHQAVYVEVQQRLADLAKHNFEVLNLANIQVVESDAVAYLSLLTTLQDTIYIDPARRSVSGRKTVFIEDCTPNLKEIDGLLTAKARRTIIKLSPMLDISHVLDSLEGISEIHILSVGNECKELLVIKNQAQPANGSVSIHCVNLLNETNKQSFSFTTKEEVDLSISYAQTVEAYLYEPNSSIMKSGAYKSVAVAFGIKKLNPNSHLYTSDRYIQNFPGRRFSVQQLVSPSKKDLKIHLANISKANITVRNYPMSVAEVRKHTKLKEGGDDYIFATTLLNDKKILILCKKADEQ